MSRKTLLAALVILAVVVLAGATWYELYRAPASSDAAVTDPGAQPVTVTAWDRSLGSPKAPILMVEYAAPSCPHCAHFDMDISRCSRRNISTPARSIISSAFSRSIADVAAEAMARCFPADNYFTVH